MSYLFGDVGFPASAAQVAADMRASGMVRIGLYAANWSAPGTVQSAAYMQAVEAAYGARCVMPIVTPGDSPPQLRENTPWLDPHETRKTLIRQGTSPRVKEGLHEDLAALSPEGAAGTVANIIQGLGMAGRWVGFDIETYSFPSVAWLQVTFAALRQIGCKVVVYGLRSTIDDYAGAGPDGWWVADWSAGSGIPSDCVARQVGDSLVVNGNTYDADYGVDGWDPVGGGAPAAQAEVPIHSADS